MAIYKSDIVDINLETGSIHRSFLNHTIGSGDNSANRFGVRTFRDGVPADLSGASCQAVFMNAAGTNIALTSYGTVSGNEAYVTLPQACYNVEGQFCLAIKLAQSGVTVTTRIVDGVVSNTGTTGSVAPTSSVPTYQEILSTYDAMTAATAAANTAIAETFDATKAYPAGKYVINSGALYRLTADHAANVTWANTSKVACNFGDELSSTKSAFSNSIDVAIFNKDFARNTKIFDKTEASAGETLYYDFSVLSGTANYIEFLDSSNQQLGYIGKGSSSSGSLTYKGAFIIPTGFDHANASGTLGAVMTINALYTEKNNIVLFDYQKALQNNLYESIPNLLGSFLPITKYIKEFSVFTTDTYSSDEVRLTEIRYIDNSNVYYVVLYNVTKNAYYYKEFSYTSRPTTGIEKIIWQFLSMWRVEITVDWSKYSSDLNVQVTNANGQPIKLLKLDTSKVIKGINTNFRSLEGIGSCIISGTFVINWPFDMVAGQKIKGNGATVTVQSGGKIFAYEDCTIEDIEFVGDWEPEREESGEGYVPLITEEGLSQQANSTLYGEGNSANSGLIVLYGGRTHNTSVIGCSFTGLRQICIIAQGGRHKTKDGTLIEGNSFTDCWMAIEQLGEFSHISNNNYFRVIVAVYIAAGNVSKVGDVFKCCDCAIFYPSGGGNPAHGEGVGIEAAHSGVAGIYCKTIPASCGEIFSGCQFVDSPIIVESGYSLLFSGCLLNTYIRIDAGQRNGIIANIVGKGYLHSNPLYAVPSDTKIINNVAMVGATDEEVNPVLV